jgi:uncharacterized protein (TIGR02246 family)
MAMCGALACLGISRTTPQAGNPQDEASLRELQAQFASAWGKSDAHEIAALFAPDADLIIPTGLVMRGRPEIEAFYGGVFAQGYRGSQAGSEILRIRFLKPDLALADATWFIRNVRTKGGAAGPVETGTLVLVAAKTAEGWRIAALRESDSAKAFRSLGEATKP